ncbi:TLE2 protein, partial [Pheucticus melanocephalus]|nr:TLE2 protein [Pheucticus melanocephalus]
QAEIVKRLSAICAQIIPCLTQEHQQQVLQAVERAKQVTMGELNSIVGQQQLQQLSQHASPLPLAPHPSSTQPPSLSGASSGLLALSGALMAQVQLAKEHRVAQDGENRGKGKKRGWWLSHLPLPLPQSVSSSPAESLPEERTGLKRKREEKELPGHSVSAPRAGEEAGQPSLFSPQEPPSEPGSPGRPPSRRCRRELPGSPASVGSSGSTAPGQPREQSPVRSPGAGGGLHQVSPPLPPGDARAKPWLSPRAALRSPLSSSSPFTSSLAMVPHATPSLCMGIHLSVPQASSTLLHGRSPVVSH